MTTAHHFADTQPPEDEALARRAARIHAEGERVHRLLVDAWGAGMAEGFRRGWGAAWPVWLAVGVLLGVAIGVAAVKAGVMAAGN